MNKDMKRMTTFLNLLLTHNAKKQGFTIDDNGYVSVSEITMKCPNITLSDIQYIINTDQYQTFELINQDNMYMVRKSPNSTNLNPSFTPAPITTTQTNNNIINHKSNNINSHPPLTRIMSNEFYIVMHEITHHELPIVKKLGIPKKDKYIKLSSKYVQQTTSNPDIVRIMVYINIRQAILDGLIFYKDASGDIYTEGRNGYISPKYIMKMEIL